MITVIFVGVVVFAAFYYLLALWCVHAFFSGKRPSSGSWAPPVSVLKPVKGLDFETLENFSSFARQDYPDYQVLFGVESEEDPAAPVIKQLIEDFPERDIRLIIAGNIDAANKKAGALAALTLNARHDILVISDSDVRVAPDYLKAVVLPLEDPTVGMVTCLYRASGAKGLAGLLESLMIHLDFFPAVLVAWRLEGLRFGLGATMALRRSALSAIGGFEAIGDYLADDYLLGHRLHRAGYRIVLSGQIVDIVLQRLGMADFLRHQLRWARTYRVCRPRGYFASILTHGVFLSLVYLPISGFTPLGWMLLSIAACARFLTAAVILAHCFEERTWARSLFILPLKESLSAAIWALAFLGNRVTWRGKTFRLDKQGRMIPIDSGS